MDEFVSRATEHIMALLLRRSLVSDATWADLAARASSRQQEIEAYTRRVEAGESLGTFALMEFEILVNAATNWQHVVILRDWLAEELRAGRECPATLAEFPNVVFKEEQKS